MTKIAYFDCFSGISGDMIIGALLDAGLDLESLRQELGKLHLKGFEVDAKKIVKQQIAATQFEVFFPDQAPLRHLADLNRIVDQSSLDQDVIAQAKKIFLKIAEAEAKIHNQLLEKVHFHEIGAVDTIVDVVGALAGLQLLGVEQVISSKLNVGTGFVEFSHGKFPVPAPATAEILKGFPVYATETDAETVTPTGAAIITTIADRFDVVPVMKSTSVGYGAGTRELKQPNVLRVFLGELLEERVEGQDTISILETNIDDMNPQLHGHVMEKLFADGALDVYLTNILMKKSRPALKLTVLCRPEDEPKLTRRIFDETTSIGVRRRTEKRAVLQREINEVDTKFGKIRVKLALLDGKVLNAAPEYDDCRRIAQEKKVPLKMVFEEVSRALG